MLGNLFSNVFQTLPLIRAISMRRFTTIFTATPLVSTNIAGGSWALTPVRNKIRNNWPRPSETKRVKTHGWKKRMSTLHGRKIIMRRILAGRFVLSH